MRIGIDFTCAVRQRAGIGRYARHLIGALAALSDGNEYRLIWAGPGDSGAAFPFAQYANYTDVPLRLSERFLNILWHRLRVPLPVNLWSGPIDLFHALDFTLPPLRRTRTLVTVHDLSFLVVPECAHPRLRSYLSTVVPRAVARADRIVAVSEHTRTDIVEWLRVDPGRVDVLYNGVGPEFSPPSEEDKRSVRRRYGLPETFILAVGTIEPRKNLPTLMRAMRILGERREGAGLPLVVAGQQGWLCEESLRSIEECGVAERVRLLGYVPEEDLPALYGAAAVLAFPSLYEGFGLPPLEAMACGTPVVASRVSSMPEVLADAALLVAPRDAEALAASIGQLLCDTALCERYIAAGLARAREFTWERSARRLQAIYGTMGGRS